MTERTLIHDISFYQGNLSRYWQLFRDAGCKAIIIQATNGLAYQQYFHDTAQEAKDEGFLVGSYHFFRQHIPNQEGTWVSCSASKQAQNYFSWVDKSGVKMDLPPALDLEEGGNPYGLGTAAVRACLDSTEKLFGRTPMIYSRSTILKGIQQADWGRFPLWLAHYTDNEDYLVIPSAWNGWTIWQYSDKVTYTPEGSTLKKPIDHNWFNGSYDDLLTFCNSTAPVPLPPKENVKVKVEWLRFRKEPSLYSGDTLAVGMGVALKLLDTEKVHGDIDYWHVSLDGYEGYISAGTTYTQLV